MGDDICTSGEQQRPLGGNSRLSWGSICHVSQVTSIFTPSISSMILKLQVDIFHETLCFSILNDISSRLDDGPGLAGS